jgi:hypothetical protein
MVPKTRAAGENTINFLSNQQPRPEGRGMLFSKGGCTQGFNTFLTALKLVRGSVQRVSNPFGTNEDTQGLLLGIFIPLRRGFSELPYSFTLSGSADPVPVSQCSP